MEAVPGEGDGGGGMTRPPSPTADQLPAAAAEVMDDVSDEGMDVAGVVGGNGNPFHVFPDLIWEKVIREAMEDPAVVWNLLEAIPPLLVVAPRTEILFEKVLPMLFKDLDKSDLLACRGVCKWWRNSVDSFIENHPCYQFQSFNSAAFQERIADHRYSSLSTKELDFVVVRGPNGFQDKLSYAQEAREVNPSSTTPPKFIGRCADFWFDRNYQALNSTMEVFYQHLEIMLNEFGAGIWHVSIPLTSSMYSMADIDHYPGFQKCLAKLPNIKSLVMGMPFELLGVTLDKTLLDNFKAQLSEMITRFPLPDLPNLEKIDILQSNHAFKIPMELVYHECILKYSAQLTELTLDFSLWNNEYGWKLRNLKKLSIEAIADRDRFQELVSNLNCPQLENFGIMKPQLSVSEVVEAIKDFPFTLVTIQICKLDYFPGVFKTWPRLHCVRALVLQLCRCPHNRFALLNLFKAFPLMEYLEIRRGSADHPPASRYVLKRDDESGSQDSQENSGTLENAVIWNTLPMLKTLVYLQ